MGGALEVTQSSIRVSKITAWIANMKIPPPFLSKIAIIFLRQKDGGFSYKGLELLMQMFISLGQTNIWKAYVGKKNKPGR